DVHVALAGGAGEEFIPGPPFDGQQTGWTFGGDEVIFANGAIKGQAGSLRAYRVSTGGARLIVPFLRSFADNRNFSVTASPDAKWILYSQLDRSGSNVMVADNH